MPRATKAVAKTAKSAAKASTAASKAKAKTAATKKAAPAKSTPKKVAAKSTKATKSAPAKSSAPAKPAKAPAKATSKAATKKAPAATKAPVKKSTAPSTTSNAPRSRPVKNTHFDKKFLDAQRELLLEERATYVRQAASLQAEADALVADFEPGDVQFDEESGEGDTLAVERERDLALSAQARAAVEEIDHALAKLDLGTYGICEISGQPIPKERLKAIPWARERVEYKAAGLSRR